MHWVYILRCAGFDDEIELHDRHLDIIYIGETERLFRRLKEHMAGHYGTASGSVTTRKYRPIRLIGLYKIEDVHKFACPPRDIIESDAPDFSFMEKWALIVENKITLQYMKAMGRKWKQVFGGIWHECHPRSENPSKNCTIDRPYCKCKNPADIYEYDDKKYWRCSQKNFWDGLNNKLDDLGLNSGGSKPCDYYRLWKKNDTFDECSIYGDEDTIKLSGQCFISSDEE